MHSPPAARWRALVLLCLAQFMLVVDITVVNVALPTIGADLGLDGTEATWVVTAYALCFGGLLLLGGRLADALGRRRAVLLGLALFSAASLACGLAPDGTVLIAGRAVQGAGAALLSPAALAIITTAFHGPERHRALGVWAAIGGTGAAAGVLLGGLLAGGPGWEWVFFVNVPVGLAVLALLPSAVAAVPPVRRPLDPAGALTGTLAAGALIFGLVRAGEDGWGSAPALGALAASAVLAIAFVLVERGVRSPLVPLPFLARRTIATGGLIMVAASVMMLSAFFLCSLYLQHVLGLSAVRTGLAFLPAALATIAGAHLASGLVGRIGPRPVAATGFALAAAGALLLARVPAGGHVLTDVLPGFVLLAAGTGAGFVCATTTAMSGIGHDEAGVASGIVSTGHEIGGALGVALAAAFAGASLGGASVDGFQDAFTVFAGVAAAVAAFAVLLVPAGRPEPGDGPVFAH
ncbi:MFS transporter [Spirillospora albida]|uniref:MFS transporter n=1 Tax=Spirillospora albida TaxID=58123 RepID=UPI000B22D187|nr:MFS transporter [Spirillospora albida]